MMVYKVVKKDGPDYKSYIIGNSVKYKIGHTTMRPSHRDGGALTAFRDLASLRKFLANDFTAGKRRFAEAYAVLLCSVVPAHCSKPWSFADKRARKYTLTPIPDGTVMCSSVTPTEAVERSLYMDSVGCWVTQVQIASISIGIAPSLKCCADCGQCKLDDWKGVHNE